MKKTLLNDNWYFSSDIDATMRPVTLPHDAMQAEARVPGLHDGSGAGYYPGGTYCYTRTLEVGQSSADETTILEFEGIYMKSSIYLNDELVGGHIYGYTNFYVDLTGKLMSGKNTLRVEADNSQFPNSRWYSGSGIYRDVVMHTAGKEYIYPDGVKAETVSLSPAKLHVTVDAVHDGDTSVVIMLYKDGLKVAEGSGNSATLTVPNAQLWSAETPTLYTLKVSLVNNETVIDEYEDRIGLRKLAWDAKNGLQVNGKTVKLRGGCVHHDHGFIGAAEYEDACLRKVRIMKEAGFNAVRISHNPASHSMLRACDKLGLYVMNESFDTWLGLKNTFDYAMYFEENWKDDLTAMIRVSYNHPSVIMYSIGNEVYLKDVKKGAQLTIAMTELCHKLDAGRPVINALNPLMVLMGNSKEPEQNREKKSNPRAAAENTGLAGSRLANTLISMLPMMTRLVGNRNAMRKKNAMLSPLDIVGLNYGDYLYDAQHKDYPDRILCGSETFPSKIATTWQMTESSSWVVGDFLWTAWDYLGEAGIGTVGYGKSIAFTQPFPTIAAGCANIDLTGEITCQGYYTAAVYGQYNVPYIAVHPLDHAGEKVFLGQWRQTDAVHSWSWDSYEGKTTSVDVYSNAAFVELFQDGKSLGKKKVKHYMASYKVTYASGTLLAFSYDQHGNIINSDTLKTASTDIRLQIQVEDHGDSLLYLPIELTDSQGIRHIRKDRTVSVSVTGFGELLGIGTAALKQESLTPYTGNTISTYEGRALAIIRKTTSSGAIDVTVSSQNLADAKITINF